MKKSLILFIIIFLPSIVYLIFSTGVVKFKLLPIIGNREGVTKTIVDGKEKVDTVYHTIPPFSFIDQDGNTVTDKTFEGKIYIANFFFSTCQTTCPRMNSGLLQVQQHFSESYPNLLYLSHSVDPKNDSVAALAAYAKKIHADTKTWHFVTGDKKAIYDIGIDGYLLPVGEDPRAQGGFLHSEQLVLIDKEKHIRGYYDGTSVKEITDLIDDVKILIAEYANKAKNERDKITKGHP